MCKFFICRFVALLLCSCLGGRLIAEDFIVGTTTGYAPFVSLNEKGEYEGFDIDFSKALGKKLAKSVVLKDLGSMPALILALQQGKIDAIIWAISITEARQQQMEMVFYQGEKVTALPLVFWKEIPKNVTSLEDVKHEERGVICVEAGSFQDSFLQSVGGLRLKHVDKIIDALLEIKYGKSMATMLDPSLLPLLQEQYPELKVMQVPLPPSQQSLGNGVCLRKNNCGLTDQVRAAVAQMREEGIIDELERKWGLTGK